MFRVSICPSSGVLGCIRCVLLHVVFGTVKENCALVGCFHYVFFVVLCNCWLRLRCMLFWVPVLHNTFYAHWSGWKFGGGAGHAVYGCSNGCMCIVQVWGVGVGMCKPLHGGCKFLHQVGISRHFHIWCADKHTLKADSLLVEKTHYCGC
jgi:hypothetical protein